MQPNELLSHRQMEHIWKKAYTYWLENLFAKILVRGELTMQDPLKAYWLLGNLAAKVLFFQVEMEAIQLERRQKESVMAKTVKKISSDNWTTPIIEGFNRYHRQWQNTLIMVWKAHLFHWL